ncbi:MAG: glutamate synthase subunit beta [Chitinophagaceae bacterium]|nr:glutamate synthase subunit beta [Chitinophagaceae bacterium]
MGKPTGFLEFTRELPGKKPVSERVQHYKEFTELYDGEKLNQQSARCMNCGVPFCHQGCPLGNIIPEFNDAVYRNDWEEAYAILSSTNNFPEFTGRICPAPCEAACVLGINQPAVTIEEIEKHIIEIAFSNGFVKPRKPAVRSGKKVAVIGSGPAGLAAAAQLNYAGHLVTVFERDDAAGGLLRYGIPDFKLEKWVVERRISLLEEEGVQFRYHAHVGVNVPVNDLIREYHAIVLACGSTVPRDLPIPGRELKGVQFAMHFLKQQNKQVAGKDAFADAETESNIYTELINAHGKNVVVIGGGDTGSDCVGTSNRQGAVSVTQLELLPQPPKERNESMPWPSYPMLLKTTTSHEEGADRLWAIATKAFLGDANGALRALQVVDLAWSFGADGKPGSFKEVAGSEREIPCELALLALGFTQPKYEGLLEQLQVERDERKNVLASEKNYQTSIPKVFAAGDIRRGQSLVVWAISEGREAARQVDLFLNHQHSLLESKNAPLILNSKV